MLKVLQMDFQNLSPKHLIQFFFFKTPVSGFAIGRAVGNFTGK